MDSPCPRSGNGKSAVTTSSKNSPRLWTVRIRGLVLNTDRQRTVPGISAVSPRTGNDRELSVSAFRQQAGNGQSVVALCPRPVRRIVGTRPRSPHHIFDTATDCPQCGRRAKSAPVPRSVVDERSHGRIAAEATRVEIAQAIVWRCGKIPGYYGSAQSHSRGIGRVPFLLEFSRPARGLRLGFHAPLSFRRPEDNSRDPDTQHAGSGT